MSSGLLKSRYTVIYTLPSICQYGDYMKRGSSVCYYLFLLATEACYMEASTPIPLLFTKTPVVRIFYFGASYPSELFLFRASFLKYAKNVRLTKYDQFLLPQPW